MKHWRIGEFDIKPIRITAFMPNAWVKAGIKKARKANTVHSVGGFDIGDIIEIDNARLAIIIRLHCDDQKMWVRPWDELREIEMTFDDVDPNAHWKKPT